VAATIKPVVYASDWLFRPEPPPLSDFGRRFLAEGDSWFTIGTLNLLEASNVLFKLEFTKSTAIANCAYPSDTLTRIVKCLRDPYFDRLLRKKPFASYWEALLISAGGNDLIDAAQVPPVGAQGQPTANGHRPAPAVDTGRGSPSASKQRCGPVRERARLEEPGQVPDAELRRARQTPRPGPQQFAATVPAHLRAAHRAASRLGGCTRWLAVPKLRRLRHPTS